MSAAFAEPRHDGNQDDDGQRAYPLDRPGVEAGLGPWASMVPGNVLGGSYRLVRHLARGGMGDIYLASHERLHSHFVLKVPSPEVALAPADVARFRHEAELMVAARHPNVVQVVDFNVTELGLPYLVMEHVAGEDLAEILGRRGTLAPAAIVDIVRQLARALDAAHERGIVHRDLKPENIMLVARPGEPDLVKIIDFGISEVRRMQGASQDPARRESRGDSQQDPRQGPDDAPWVLAGTPDFMAPELLCAPGGVIDGRSDQFSLAVIVHVLLTGRTPWGPRDSLETAERVATDRGLSDRLARRLSFVQGSPCRSDHVEAVLTRGMATLPELRFDTMFDFARALERAMLDDGLLAASVERGAEPPAERATGAELLEDGSAHAWPGDQVLDDDPGAIPRVLSPSPEPEPRRVPGRENTGTERVRVRRPGRHLPRRGVGPRGPGRPSFVQRVGLDAVLVLLAVFGAVWMGKVDPPVVRQRVESSLRSVEQTLHSSVALTSGGSGFLNKLRPREPGDLALAPAPLN
jgi:serine/threonine protein kinase